MKYDNTSTNLFEEKCRCVVFYKRQNSEPMKTKLHKNSNLNVLMQSDSVLLMKKFSKRTFGSFIAKIHLKY